MPKSKASTTALQYTLSANSALSDDYIWTADVLVDQQNASTVGVFQNSNGQSQALIVSQGVLNQVSPNPGQSSAGWTITPVGSTSGVTQAVCGVQNLPNDQNVHAFYTDPDNLYHVLQNSDGSWSSPDTLPLCGALNVATNVFTGELIVYGVDGNGNLLFVRQSSQAGGQWSAVSIPFPVSLTGSTPVLVLNDDSCDWTLAIAGSAKTGGVLEIFTGSPSASGVSGPAQVPVANPVQQVVVGYYAQAETTNSPLFLFTDTSQNLYTCWQTTTAITQIAGISVSNAAAIVDTDNLLHVFAADQNGTLTVLHQTDSTDAGPVWAPPIPLDSGFTTIFADSNPMDTWSFFALDGEGALWSYVQDPTTSLWASAKAQQPGGAAKPYHVAQYRTEVTVSDQYGNPASNITLNVSADSTSAVLAQGVFYPVGPGQPTPIQTNSAGKVTLSTIASGLYTPALTITADGLTTPPAVNPAAAVHGYLSGTGTLNNGTSQQLPQFSADTLTAAQVNGQPLAPATQDPNSGSQVAQAAASSIMSAFQVKSSTGTIAKSGRPPIVGWALDLSDRANPVYREFHTEEAFQAHRRTVLAQTSASADDSWWRDIADYAEDFWQGVRQGVTELTNIVVHVADATADFIVDGIHNLVGILISAADKIAAVAQSVFSWIKAEVNAVINWLKMLFDWQDIQDTANAFAMALTGNGTAAIPGAFPYLQQQIESAETWVNGFFTKIEGEVSQAFDTLIAQYQGGSQTLGSLSNGPSQMQLARRRLADATGAQISNSDIQSWQDNCQLNWLIEKIESFLGSDSLWNSVPGLDQPFQTLVSSWNTAEPQFQSAVSNLWDAFTTTVTDPSKFATIGVADFLTAAKEFVLGVLTLLDGIIIALLQLMDTALNFVTDILNAKVSNSFLLGVINDILDGSSTETVGEMFCTALAIPVTIIYKLITNDVDGEPFPGGTLPIPNQIAAVNTGNVQAAAVGVAFFWALFDAGLDAASADAVIFDVIDIIFPTVLGVLTWPGFSPFSSPPLNTDEERASYANWVVGWGVVAAQVGSILFLGEADAGGDLRYTDMGMGVMTFWGTMNLISGIVASSYGTSGAGIAANILGPLPNMFQFLRTTPFNASEWARGAKLCIDFFVGEGYTIALGAE